jgi:F-type H+-transporting ATPase subunit b
MKFDWVTFGLQLVNVLVLLAILRHFLFRPVADIIARRQSEIAAAKDAADAARAEAAKAAAEAGAEAQKTASARQEVLAGAQADAQARSGELIEAARAEAARIVAQAHAQAEQDAADSREQTLRRARDLAETIARSALAGLPRPPGPEGFCKRLADELEAMEARERDSLFAGERLRVVTPAPLAQRDRKAVKAVLAPFGVAAPQFEVDPSLIAGLDLKSSNGIVHNSLAHDLQSISEALRDGDGSPT